MNNFNADTDLIQYHINQISCKMLRSFGEQLQKPTGFFGKIVGKMMESRNHGFYKKTIAELDIKSGDSLFEIGYGTGMGIHMIAEKNTECTIGGIDFSELMYHQATRRNKKFIENGKVELHFGDLLTADFSHKKYDKIFCLNVIYFWTDLGRVFAKIHNHLNTGGMFIIFMSHEKELAKLKFTGNFCKYTLQEVEAALTGSGFSRVSSILDKGYYIKAFP
jgi:arsenite methyltransferase